MSDLLAQRVLTLEDDFFNAIRLGSHAVAMFNARYLDLRRDLQQAADSGLLSDDIRDLARSSAAGIMEHAGIVRGMDARFVEIAESGMHEGDADVDAAHLASAAASLPLFRYFLSNICLPYPEAEEKERLAEEVRNAGWRDFDKKKVEDWLNRKRNQSGCVAILRNYCDDDHEAMRQLCRTALYGSPADKARLPAGSVEDVEDMLDYMQSQHDELAEAKDSTWVDNLATRVHAILGDASAADGVASLETYDDDDNTNDDFGSDTDSASGWSDTDVEEEEEDDDDDEEDDEEPARVIVGAKRKLNDSCYSFSASVGSQPLARSPSLASSSSSGSSACSFRSFSGSSMTSVTSVECEDDDADDDMGDRPAKRSRMGPCSFDAESVLSGCATEALSPATALSANPLFTTYQTGRKRSCVGLSSRTRSMKRSRYVALGVASQIISPVADAHLSTLSRLCSLAWTPTEVALSDLDADSFTVDCTQFDEESEPEDYAIFGEREDDEPAEDVPTWSKLQIHTILCMLLAASGRPLPASLAQSTAYTYAFDIDTFGVYNATDLEDMMKLTPEALSAIFDAMNHPAPASAPAEETLIPAAGTVAFAEETAVPSSEDALLSLEAPSPTRDSSASAPDVPAPALTILNPLLDAPVPALDAPVAAVETPGLSIDTSSVALEPPASATDEPPSPTSSSSSEGDSPPALSDDSGSSSRSSSVESDSEQDSLLLSPATLSADYCQTNDELSVGKALSVDASPFQVEFGALPEVTTADEWSCASELLERYLNDQMTWS